jgi:outer membrane protein OmpA-like peptidoglycan-associated protein
MLLSRNQPVTPPVAQVTAPAVSVPTPAPAAPPAAVTNTVDTLNQQLSQSVLNFPTGSAVLPAASEPNLQQAADLIKGLPAGTVIQIGGHTDNTGNPAANMTLSQQRAEAVRDALVRDGVDTSRLAPMGFGDTKPIASNDTPEGRLQNRRTEFSVASATQTTTTTPAAPAAPNQ